MENIMFIGLAVIVVAGAVYALNFVMTLFIVAFYVYAALLLVSAGIRVAQKLC